jgi:dihydroxyacetone kinase-like protein
MHLSTLRRGRRQDTRADVTDSDELQPPVDVASIAGWLRAASERLHDARDELTELDRLRGDADHGVNIDNGFAAAAAAAAGDGLTAPGAALLAAGAALAARAGGTSGPLWGAALERVADEIGPGEQTTWERFSSGLIAAGLEISEIGGAHEGDNTMLDVLGPAARMLHERVVAGEPITETLTAVGELAGTLAAATAHRAARRGRAAYLGDRAIGTPDPGCVSASIVIAALAAALPAAQ